MLEQQKINKEFLGQILLASGRIKETDLLSALSEQFNIPLVSLKDKYIDWNLVKQFSSSLIQDYRCFPVARDDEYVTVAVNNPLDAWVLHKAEEELKGLKLKLVLASSQDLDEVIHRYTEFIRGNISKLLD
jgi:type IV pilus assembly protein PilB